MVGGEEVLLFGGGDEVGLDEAVRGNVISAFTVVIGVGGVVGDVFFVEARGVDGDGMKDILQFGFRQESIKVRRSHHHHHIFGGTTACFRNHPEISKIDAKVAVGIERYFVIDLGSKVRLIDGNDCAIEIIFHHRVQ